MNFTEPHSAQAGPNRIAYVLKRYPRFSETFIVNEILAHEAAGVDMSIFALRPTADTHFQHAIADVKAPVTHLRYGGIKAETVWAEMLRCGKEFSNLWTELPRASGYVVSEVYQALQLARAVRDREIEHLHAHFGTSAASVARLASLLTGVPYTFTAHAKDIFHEYVDEDLLGRKLADAAAVVTVSEFNVGDLCNRFQESANKIHRIYNGLHLDNFPYSSPQNRPPQIVAVGRLVEKKGFGDLITACELLAKSEIDFHCKIIGGGDLQQALHNQIVTLGLQQKVELVGPQPQQEVLKTIRESSVCVAPCVTASTGDRDGLPTILLEAMATGTACLATTVTGIPELIQHEETGLLAPEGEPATLALQLKRLLVDGQLQLKLSAAGRALIEEQFDVRKSTLRMRELFAACTLKPATPTLAEVG